MGLVHIIGAGLSGSEAAWAAARAGAKVRLYEMRPTRMTPAHHTEGLAELVCSNSLGGEGETNAKGLLQAEMRAAGSLIMQSADANRVPAGAALAVEREGFSQTITEALSRHPNVEIVREEIGEIPEGIVVIATGPLTSDALAERLRSLIGEE
ncbi:MAG: methylenetetrahydrofolate--tRNA-(uracil(54)-C(5))-methyltransferase (FADH(2)-oxidizing) TrmFO, partial [Meiothermus sp.]